MTEFMCQCPQRAGPHFYKDRWKLRCLLSGSVNALNGRDLISTPLLWSPVFMRVSRPLFPRIFLNILIIHQNKGQKWAEHELYFFANNFEACFSYNYKRFIHRNNHRFSVLTLSSSPSHLSEISKAKVFQTFILLPVIEISLWNNILDYTQMPYDAWCRGETLSLHILE